jgi:hypothetical protein
LCVRCPFENSSRFICTIFGRGDKVEGNRYTRSLVKDKTQYKDQEEVIRKERKMLCKQARNKGEKTFF